MSKLQELSALVKASWSIEFNPHKAYYEDAESYFGRDTAMWEAIGDIDWGKDIWDLCAYPNTPVAFIRGLSNDLDSLIEWAIKECG